MVGTKETSVVTIVMKQNRESSREERKQSRMGHYQSRAEGGVRTRAGEALRAHQAKTAAHRHNGPSEDKIPSLEIREDLLVGGMGRVSPSNNLPKSRVGTDGVP